MTNEEDATILLQAIEWKSRPDMSNVKGISPRSEAEKKWAIQCECTFKKMVHDLDYFKSKCMSEKWTKQTTFRDRITTAVSIST